MQNDLGFWKLDISPVDTHGAFSDVNKGIKRREIDFAWLEISNFVRNIRHRYFATVGVCFTPQTESDFRAPLKTETPASSAEQPQLVVQIALSDRFPNNAKQAADLFNRSILIIDPRSGKMLMCDFKRPRLLKGFSRVSEIARESD